jgi:glycosyltransferase involved in cell wall biosynthesis
MKIVIWTGAAWEPWGPPSVDVGGIGGSETAAVAMARELARRGHEVVMFGEHKGFEGIWQDVDRWGREVSAGESSKISSVKYVRYQDGVEDPKLLECDVFVSSRDKRAIRLLPDGAAKAKVLWIHDVHCGDDWDNDVLRFDRVYCLTKWHKGFVEGMYPHVDPAKIKVTRNGIDPDRFRDLDWKAKGPSFVYSSSPDRGLDVLLDMWPKIRALEPGATLDVYYGFENWRKLNAENKRGLAVVNYMFERVTSMADEGVRYHGRVGQRELAEAQKKALIWFYPTRFSETYAITALEAQAAGCCVVTSKLAALEETASIWTLLEGSNKSPAYQEKALDLIAHYLTAWEIDNRVSEVVKPGDCHNPGHLTAQAARSWALKQTWASVAEDWERDFEELVPAEQCGQCGAVIEGYHACPGVPGWEEHQ